jgi:hypothetical protein
MAQKPAAPRRRIGLVIGLVSLIVLISTGIMLLTLHAGSQQPTCTQTPCPPVPSAFNPSSLPESVLNVLFVLGAIGTVGSVIQQAWSLSKFVAQRTQRRTPAAP